MRIKSPAAFSTTMLSAVMLAVSLTLAPTAAGAQDRAVNTALGAGAGAIVAGPVGLVAGGAIGFFAGKNIARSLDLESKPRRRHRRHRDARR